MSDKYTLHHGDCLEVMAGMEDNSIDTVITDPPYGLQFMGKDWDHGIPGERFWAEVLRVAKPGAMLLAFGGTRTFHRLACAIEDAGWIIRDCLMYLYGSGFPKSLDISKAIDKRAGAEREVVGQRSTNLNRPITDKWDKSNQNLNGSPFNPSNGNLCPITAPATDAARLWDGWGSSLKPAWEPVILAMKPLDGTFAENALRWGVAGLNIDGARIGTDGDKAKFPVGVISQTENNYGNGKGLYDNRPRTDDKYPQGRWPANLILSDDPEVTAGFPVTTSGGTGGGGKTFHGQKYIKPEIKINGSSGSAARYFYCAKASKSERNHGLPDGITNKHPTVKPVSLCQYLARLTKTPTGGIVLDPFCGSGSIGVAAILEGRQFIGIDQDADSIEVARYRLDAAVEETAVTQMELELNG